MVADLDMAEAQVLAIGATLLDGSDKPIGESASDWSLTWALSGR
ncbi:MULTISPECIES: hypothetical protein [Streptomyces]|nr:MULTISPECIES: hypothetical protein [Streptomyces]